MKIFGLTGKTGSGKTTVSALLAQKGYYIIAGDVLARKVTEKGSKTLLELCEAFGNDIIAPDGSLKRKYLVEKISGMNNGVEILNSITHPAIDALFAAEIAKAEAFGFEVCVFDAAALLESPSKDRCEKIIVVTAPEEIRLKRITERDSITSRQALQRMSMQKDDEYYFSKADIIIRNYYPYSLEEEINKIG